MRTNFDSQWVGMIARHIAAATATDRDIDAAAARVAAAVPESERAEVAAVARVVRDGRAALDPRSLSRSPLLGFIELLEGSVDRDVDRARALHRFEEARRDLTPPLTVAVKRLGDTASYSLSMGIAFAMIVVVYAVYLLPQFVDMFTTFGADLPMLTRLVLANEPALFALVFVVLAFAGASLALNRHAQVRLLALRPLDRRLLGRPLVGGIATAYNRAVCLAYACVLQDAGGSEARRRATALTGIVLEGDGSTLASSLAIADALGRSREELERQFVEAATELPIAFDAALQRLDAVIKFVLAFAIGLLVIAMYLPIFKLGSII